MTKPVTIPNTFATATTAIPLSQLDSDFSTVATALNDANTYSNYAADTGVANAYVVTLSGVSTTYSAGLRIQFKAGASNTGASTLNVNGGGTKNITFQDASALSSGTIAANAIVDVMYDGTQFLLMNDPAGATGGDVVGPASATDNAIVRFDGATGKLVQNSLVTIADSTGDISGVGTLNATTLDATNIEVTNIKAKDGTAAASIADSTGVISVTANPVLSGGTADGVLYLNGSKVATSGSALTFDGTIFSANQINIKSANNLRLLNSDNTNSAGIWNPGSSGGGLEQIAFSSGGTEQMRLTSTGLGIGTSSPSQRLTVSVTDAAQSTSFQAATGRIRFRPYVDATNGAIIDATNTAESAYIPLSLTGSVVRFAAGANSLLLDSSGNLGLGVTPSAWGNGGNIQLNGANIFGNSGLTYGANAYYNAGWKYITSGVGAQYCNQYNGQHQWFTAPSGTAGNAITFTQAMTLDSSGRLGIGVTSPATKLQVNVASDTSIHCYSPSAAVAQIAALNDAGNSSKQLNLDGSPLVFGVEGVERARITSGGDLLVGTTSQSGKLAVNGVATSAPLVTFYSSTAGDVGQPGLLIGKQDNDTTTSQIILRASILSTGAGAGQINMNGANTLAFGTYSDARLKENITDLPSQLANIMALRPVEFDYIESEGGGHQIGFIAQEMQQVYPDAVGEREDGMLTVSAWSKTEARLVKAIQEQQALITSLTARVALLEGN